MKTTRIIPRRRILALLLVVAALLLTVSGAFANTKTGFGGDLPLYARFQPDLIVNDGKWVAIVFYRPPECVPENFNLLVVVDFDAFACTPPTTDGIAVWLGEPGASPPLQLHLHENGLVPVWFVAWDEMQAAIADNELTMPELEALPSLLVGAADFYSETLHADDAHNVPMINYVAKGSLEDGRSFYVHAQAVFTFMVVQISFK